MLELCVGLCKLAKLRPIVCRLVKESSADGAGSDSSLLMIAHWAAVSPTELTVAVDCLHHIYEEIYVS